MHGIRSWISDENRAVIVDFVRGKASRWTAPQNVAELTAQAQTFADKQLPILKALGIA